MRTPITHFMSLWIPKNAITKTVHVPLFLGIHHTAPKLVHHQAFQPPGFFLAPSSSPRLYLSILFFFFFFFFFNCEGGGAGPLLSTNTLRYF